MNKFGRSLPSASRQKGSVRMIQTSNAIAVTSDGDYNFQDRRLCNVKPPVDKGDAVNKEFVESMLMTYAEISKQSLKDQKQKFDDSLAELNARLNVYATVHKQ